MIFLTENNDNRNTITYDDEWKSVSYSEYPKVSEELDSDEEDVNSLSAYSAVRSMPQHGNGTIQTLKNPLFLIRAIIK